MSRSLTYNPHVPILDEHTFDFFSRSPEQTRRIGTRLGKLLQSGDMICLRGELGAGKTTLVQGLAEGWGSVDDVSSPTFVLVNEYSNVDGARLFHLDAYRLQSAREAAQLDIDRMLDEGALVVEWPERIEAVLPNEELGVSMEFVAEEQRKMRFEAIGARSDRVLEELQQLLFGVP